MWTLALSLVGCAPPPYDPPATDTGGGGADSAVVDTDPGIAISYPQNETPVTGCVMVVVDVANVKLVDPMVSTDPVAGEGHYHLTHNGEYTVCTRPYCLIGFKDGQEGQITVTATLVGNDHQPYVDADGAPLEDNLLVNVTAGECTEGTPGASY